MNKNIQHICKIGQGAPCCKYLLCGADGFECGKTDIKMKALIDHKWAHEDHVAQGDNCEGKPNIELN
jgi:hypothetical protein